MADGPDYLLHLGGALRDACDEDDSLAATALDSSRKWIGISFDCCGVYCRIYRLPDGTAYQGRCPRCLRTLTLRVGPDGVSDRIFHAS